MNSKRHKTLLVSLVIEFGILITIVIFKIIYYINIAMYQYGLIRYRVLIEFIESSFWSFMGLLLWTVVSIAFSIIPVVLLIKPGVAEVRRNDSNENDPSEYKPNDCALYLKFVALNIILEIVSVIGATMCLDGLWLSIAVKMFLCHVISLIPYIMTREAQEKKTYICRAAVALMFIVIIYIYAKIASVG